MNEKPSQAAPEARHAYIKNRLEHLEPLRLVACVPIPKDADWNLGGHKEIGSLDIARRENSTLAAEQFLVCLAASPEYTDPNSVDALLTDPERVLRPEHLKDMIAHQVLRGMKILDLGCGTQPVCARVLRAMGATVHTVDTLPASAFQVSSGKRDTIWHKREIQYHHQVDVHVPTWIERIQHECGRDFDVVMSAHLESDSGPLLKIEDVKDLLKKDGIYFRAGSSTIQIRP